MVTADCMVRLTIHRVSDSAITDLRMREKNTVCVDFLMNISVCRLTNDELLR